MEAVEKDQECIEQEWLKMTLVGQDVSPKESVNHGKEGAHLVSALPLGSPMVDVSKKGNFVSGEVEDLRSVSHDEEDQWEEDASVVEWSTVGKKKNNKSKNKNRKNEGEKAEQSHPKNMKRGPKPKGDASQNRLDGKPPGVSRKHGDVGSSLSPVGRPSNQ